MYPVRDSLHELIEGLNYLKDNLKKSSEKNAIDDLVQHVYSSLSLLNEFEIAFDIMKEEHAKMRKNLSMVIQEFDDLDVDMDMGSD